MEKKADVCVGRAGLRNDAFFPSDSGKTSPWETAWTGGRLRHWFDPDRPWTRVGGGSKVVTPATVQQRIDSDPNTRRAVEVKVATPLSVGTLSCRLT